MTLCKYRSQRTYDGQFLIDEFDADGLQRVLYRKIAYMGTSNDKNVAYYIGASVALSTLFDYSRDAGMIDRQDNFMDIFDERIKNVEGDL